MPFWTNEKIEEALQRADMAASVELPIEQFTELLNIALNNGSPVSCSGEKEQSTAKMLSAKTVPAEPTDEMLEAAIEALDRAWTVIEKMGGHTDLLNELNAAETGLRALALTAQDGLAAKGCEVCEHTGRIECLPDDEAHTHPCDTCQPEANKEFQRGVAFAQYEAQDGLEALLDSIEGPHELTRTANGKYRFKIWGDYAEKRLSVTGEGPNPAAAISAAMKGE